VGQFTWGAIQPIAGALADRYGSVVVLRGSLVLMAAGCALTPFMDNQWGLILSLGLLTSMGSGAGSFSVLIGSASRHIPLESRGMASGVINAGGSFGQFLFSPILQGLIQALGWLQSLWVMALLALGAFPLVNRLKTAALPAHSDSTTASNHVSLSQALREAFRTPGYYLLNAGFFTCGFHVAFLSTHLPNEVSLCGLPPTVASWSLALIGLFNIGGSLLAGACISTYRSKSFLSLLYASRALLIVLYLLSPKTALSFYLFAAGLGVSWLATVPPTAALVGKLFGTRYLSTLFGISVLSHQVGAFLGAWLGGWVVMRTGNYDWMWWMDIALALLAAVVNLPIPEKRIFPLAEKNPAA
jgi:MFS family permease